MPIIKDRYVWCIDLVNSNWHGYYLYNAHGDVVGLGNNAGALTRQYRYDAFGVEIDKNPSDQNPFRYAGEYFDTETGNYYLRHRYYQPATGRFLSEDPVKDGLNWYTFCGNNPVMFVDPYGLSAKSVMRQLARWVIANPAVVWVTQNPGWVGEKIFYAAGFNLNKSTGTYHARQDTWQQIGGFNNFYDTAFDYATN